MLIRGPSIRTVGSTELANDRALLRQVEQLFTHFEHSSSPYSIIFPFLPTLGKLRKIYAGVRLYLIVNRVVKARKQAEVRQNDPLQYLLDTGASNTDIVAFIVGCLFAGIVNAGVNVAATVSYLAASPEWMTKVRSEIKSFLVSAGPNTGDELHRQLDKLHKIPLSAWEDASNFPVLEDCFRESMRLNIQGGGFRRNISKHAVRVGDTGAEIPAGGFAAIHWQDMHMDPQIWKDPEQFDPSRYERGEQNAKPYAFLPWGRGKHACVGVRWAKLELTMIVVGMLCAFERIELIDEEGAVTRRLPQWERNWHSAERWHGVRLRCYPRTS